MLAALLLTSALAGAAPPDAAPARPATPAAPAAGKVGPAGGAVTDPRWPSDPVRLMRQAERRLREALASGAGTAALGDVVSDYVDYEGLARRSLGKAWARQPAADRAALVKALRALLEATYLTGLGPGGEAALELREAGRSGKECVLQGTITSGERVVPIELRLERGADRRPWRVFDATVGGLAMLEGYQEQFPQLLALGGMKRLLAQLEAERLAQLARHAPPPAEAGPAPSPPR